MYLRTQSNTLPTHRQKSSAMRQRGFSRRFRPTHVWFTITIQRQIGLWCRRWHGPKIRDGAIFWLCKQNGTNFRERARIQTKIYSIRQNDDFSTVKFLNCPVSYPRAQLVTFLLSTVVYCQPRCTTTRTKFSKFDTFECFFCRFITGPSHAIIWGLVRIFKSGT